MEIFLLTRPSRDVTEDAIRNARLFLISTHTSLAGRDRVKIPTGHLIDISTHTSLAGRDHNRQQNIIRLQISTHTSLAGRDCAGILSFLFYFIFLLTRPSRDVTYSGIVIRSTSAFLLTRPSRDVTPALSILLHSNWHFYSHVPRGT